jgi:hypothetical protein
MRICRAVCPFPPFPTRYWQEKAQEVIGVKPSAEMRQLAEAQTRTVNIQYREEFSHQTGLPDRCAAIITCCQSLHWMDPQHTSRFNILPSP